MVYARTFDFCRKQFCSEIFKLIICLLMVLLHHSQHRESDVINYQINITIALKDHSELLTFVEKSLCSGMNESQPTQNI